MTYRVDYEIRPKLIALLKASGGSSTTAALAKPLGRSTAAVLQLCYALAADRVLRGERGPACMTWRLTGNPLPENFTHTGKDCRRDFAGQRFDHGPLAAALGMPDTAPGGLSRPTIIHRVGGANAG